MAYQDYSIGKQTLSELSQFYKVSTKTLQRKFHKLKQASVSVTSKTQTINLIFDATFFSRRDDVLVFRAHHKNIHWRFINSETLKEIKQGLKQLEQEGYCFLSFTMDGRKGVI